MIVQELLTKLGFVVDPAGAKKAESVLGDFKSFALKLGIGAGIAMIGHEAFKTATQMEDLGIQFKTLLGSQAAGADMMAKVTKMAAATPYELPELADSTKKLVAYGIENAKIIPTLTAVGDVAAGLKIPIGELADIYGKAKTSQTLYTEDINQLTGRGIPIIKEFAKQLGVPESQVKKMASQGKISFEMLEKAFADLTGEGGKFNGMMAELAKSASGKTSTAMDNLKMGAGRAMNALLPIYKGLMDVIAGINFDPMVAFFEKAAVGIQYFGKVVWDSGLADAFAILKQTISDVMTAMGGATDSAGGMGSILLVLGRVVGWTLSIIFRAAAVLLTFTKWAWELAAVVAENKDIFIGLGIILATLFGPAMIARILATSSAMRIAAIANAFFAQSALAGGAAAGYQVTMLGMLKAAAFNIRGAFMAARTAVMGFGLATIGVMALAFAAIASVGFAVYRIWQAVSEKRELEEMLSTEEKKAKIADQILEDTKEWRKAKDRGDTVAMEEMSKRIAERRAAYKAAGASAKQSLEENSFPSFEAMMQTGTGKLDVMMQKTVGAGKGITNVNNNMEFTVNAEQKGGQVGLTPEQVAELAAQAARATFSIQLQKVSVGMV